MLASSLPLAACCLQWVCWPVIRPFAWFLFYPTVFISSWLGGLGAGLTASVLSIALAWWFYLEPVRTLVKPGPAIYLNASMFLAMGWLFSYFYERLRQADRRAAAAKRLEQDHTLDRMSLDLRESEARYRSIFEQAGVGVVEMDAATGRFLQVNGKFCEIIGYTEEELLGMGFQDVTHPDDLGRNQGAIRQMAAGQRPEYSTEKRYLRKDGAEVWAELTVRPLRPSPGPVAHMVSIITDITARKSAEAEIQRLNATLERRVSERTTELQAANHELECFAYAISHDLRAPLRAMAGFGQALQEDCAAVLPAESRNHLERIIHASRRMAGLVDGLLHLSRTTRCELLRAPVDLSAISETLLEDLGRSSPGRAVRRQVEPGIQVQGDPRLLEALMANLLGNAWKYTSKAADASITVDTVQEDGTRWIRVADNGCGFDMAFADNLYKPFQRLHREDEYPGLGIGLATVQRIVQRHGGRLRAVSSPDRGAAFYLDLPVPEST